MGDIEHNWLGFTDAIPRQDGSVLFYLRMKTPPKKATTLFRALSSFLIGRLFYMFFKPTVLMNFYHSFLHMRVISFLWVVLFYSLESKVVNNDISIWFRVFSNTTKTAWGMEAKKSLIGLYFRATQIVYSFKNSFCSNNRKRLDLKTRLWTWQKTLLGRGFKILLNSRITGAISKHFACFK